MMKCIALITLIACVWAAPQQAEKETQPLQLSDLISNAQKNINELATNIKNQLNLPDQETVVNTLKNQSSAFVSNVQEYVNKASEEIKNKSPELEKLWGDFKQKVTKVVEDINANVPNAKESAEQLQKQFNEGVQAVVNESNKIAEAVKQNSGNVKEEVARITKNAVDLAVGAAHNLNEELKKAAEKKE